VQEGEGEEFALLSRLLQTQRGGGACRGLDAFALGVDMNPIKSALNLGCILICSLFSLTVEAQETPRVLQCDVTAWLEDLTGQQTGSTSKYSFMLEFLPNGRVLWVLKDVTSELTVTVAETTYVFKRDAGGLFMTLDRLTGVLRSTDRVDERLIDAVGSCHPIKVVPKL
jgi:hypothetical protein